MLRCLLCIRHRQACLQQSQKFGAVQMLFMRTRQQVLQQGLYGLQLSNLRGHRRRLLCQSSAFYCHVGIQPKGRIDVIQRHAHLLPQLYLLQLQHNIIGKHPL